MILHVYAQIKLHSSGLRNAEKQSERRRTRQDEEEPLTRTEIVRERDGERERETHGRTAHRGLVGSGGLSRLQSSSACALEQAKNHAPIFGAVDVSGAGLEEFRKPVGDLAGEGRSGRRGQLGEGRQRCQDGAGELLASEQPHRQPQHADRRALQEVRLVVAGSARQQPVQLRLDHRPDAADPVAILDRHVEQLLQEKDGRTLVTRARRHQGRHQ
jgi:hypothetical protein